VSFPFSETIFFGSPLQSLKFISAGQILRANATRRSGIDAMPAVGIVPAGP
jgi:hypothetical protein